MSTATANHQRGGNSDHYNELSKKKKKKPNLISTAGTNLKTVSIFNFYVLWIDTCWSIKHEFTSCSFLSGVRRTLTQLVATCAPQMCWRKQTPENKNVESNRISFHLFEFLSVLHVLVKKSTDLFTADTLDITDCNFSSWCWSLKTVTSLFF